MYALDISNWQGEISDATVACWKAAGIGLVVVRLSLETNAKAQLALRQLDVCKRGGLLIAGYQWDYWRWDPVQTTDWTMQLIGDRKLEFIAQDVEDPDGVLTPDKNAAWIRKSSDTYNIYRQKNLIYTGKWFWDSYMRGITSLSDIPLWDANYDGTPIGGFIPYGGWQKETISQFNSAYDLCGYELDINWIDDAYLEVPPVAEVTREEFEELKKQVQRNQDSDYVRALLAEFRDDEAITKIEEMKVIRQGG